jgi:hypothetical protein
VFLKFRLDSDIRQTDQTTQFVTNMVVAPFRSCYPMALSPWGIVPDVLLVAALEVGHPVEILVTMKADDLTGDSDDSGLLRLHCGLPLPELSF